MRLERLVCYKSKLLNVKSIRKTIFKRIHNHWGEIMFGLLLKKEHVLEIESLVIRSLSELDKELISNNLNEHVKKELEKKKEILNEVYMRLPL